MNTLLSWPRAALAVGLLLAGGAHAQLWQTPQATAAQAVLKGFSASDGALVRGETRLTLDVVAGRVVGVLVETPSVADLARGLGAAWGIPEANLAALQRNLEAPQLLAAAQRGLVQPSDGGFTDVIALKVTGTGAAQRWTAYVAVQIWPDSAFPVTANVSGKADAPGNLRIFSDFQCPYCKQLWDKSLRGWERQSALYQVRHYQFPLEFHANAFVAAEASECAGAQGKFWPLADALFQEFAVWTKVPTADAPGKFSAYAATAGLDTAAFKTCLGARTMKPVVEAQYAAGLKLGVQGTPTVFLNGVKLNNYTDAEEFGAVQAVTAARPSAAALIEERLKAFR